MTRKIKALGLALVASLAVSALVASGAQALEFHSTAAHTILKGEQGTVHKFQVGSGFGAITCKVAIFTGTTTKTTETSQTIEPEYKECSDSIGRTVHVVENATYVNTAPAVGTGSTNVHVSGTFTLEITNSNKQVICVVHIATQTDNGISYHNSGSNVESTINTTNVVSTTTGGFLNCGVNDGTYTSGTYSGTVLMKGVDTEGKSVTISVS